MFPGVGVAGPELICDEEGRGSVFSLSRSRGDEAINVLVEILLPFE